MAVMIDTSAIVAVMDTADDRHAAAGAFWREMVETGEEVHVSNYVLAETYAVLQRRYGIPAITHFMDEIEPLFTVHWVDADAHSAARALMAQSCRGRRSPSIVDCVLYVQARRMSIRGIFTYDKHFASDFDLAVLG